MGRARKHERHVEQSGSVMFRCGLVISAEFEMTFAELETWIISSALALNMLKDPTTDLDQLLDICIAVFFPQQARLFSRKVKEMRPC